MRKLIVLFSMVIVSALAITFALRNPQVVEINYYMGFIWQGRLTFLLLISFSIGMVFSALIMSISLVKHRARVSKANRRTLELENQIEELKVINVDEV